MLENSRDFKITEHSPSTLGSDGLQNFKNAYLYNVLVDHQTSSPWWDASEMIVRLRQGAEKLLAAHEFRCTRETERLGVPLIKIEPANVKQIGSYHPEADGYAINGTILFNAKRVFDLPEVILSAYLLRFLACSWRHHTGGDGSFDKAARDRLAGYGLCFDAKGNVAVERSSVFGCYLADNDIDIPGAMIGLPPAPEPKATSKVWSCLCQRARVGTKEFVALCPRCRTEFRIGDHITRG